jgi:hypothetical protein
MHRTQNLSVCAADIDDTTEVVTPATTLRAAAHYLSVYGWTQSLYYSDKKIAFPPACADGAIGMAALGGVTACPGREGDNPNFRDYNRAFHYFTGYLHQSGWKPPCDPWCGIEPGDCLCDNDHDEIVFAWNDDDTRTADEVIAALNAAADEYDWQHATTEELDAFAETLIGTKPRPIKEAFLAWRAAR